MTSKKSIVAKEKLLAAASDVFGKKGFRDATVAEICRRAGANIAAVNYHFGNKEALYRETWRQSFAESIQAHPQDGGIPPDAPAEQRLRGQITALMRRVADPENREFVISQMELINPTGLLEEVMKSALIPLREKTLTVVRELLGPEVDEQHVVHCEICILSMCLHPMLIQRIRQRTKKVGPPLVIDDLDAFADHVVLFALAGIQVVRDQPRKSGSRS
ncbi:CerR family C-terminal domain-containing protein [Desulfonatronum sp. SC1]|uniref:CerR family C-terminal domain-containing protein n=1 Tax=Desulfonatronum sp. SC1 TaxID=2109626 RepID=UPI000D30223C|nr:CerR family C-terminal domain-containing protein [Desulfonatronum sp. SC1]PTN34488.1 DUF1956 domain-containing protein [Desulfonatronum sp. SC1]